VRYIKRLADLPRILDDLLSLRLIDGAVGADCRSREIRSAARIMPAYCAGLIAEWYSPDIVSFAAIESLAGEQCFI
jgi:hypothetical protein